MVTISEFSYWNETSQNHWWYSFSSLRGVADEPVYPVEDWSAAVVWVAARHGDEGLHEAEAGADDPEQRVRVLRDGNLRPALKMWINEPWNNAFSFGVSQIAL